MKYYFLLDLNIAVCCITALETAVLRAQFPSSELRASVEHWIFLKIHVGLTCLWTARRWQKRVSAEVEFRKLAFLKKKKKKRAKHMDIHWLLQVSTVWGMNRRTRVSWYDEAGMGRDKPMSLQHLTPVPWSPTEHFCQGLCSSPYAYSKGGIEYRPQSSSVSSVLWTGKRPSGETCRGHAMSAILNQSIL